MNIAIIGGSGFIGTNLIPLLMNNHNIVIVDKQKSFAFPDLWTFGDVRDKNSFSEVIKNCDCIINLAAEHKDNVVPKSLYYDVNVIGARNICEVAEKTGINRIIFTSSVAVYGFVKRETDEDGALRPNNNYGISKLQAEAVYRTWCASSVDKSLVIIRPTVVFGENNRGNVYNLLNQIVKTPFFMIGNGRNVKSMAYVKNLSAFMATMIDADPGTYIYNYADKPDLSVNDLFLFTKTIITGTSKGFIRIPYPIAYIGSLIIAVFSFIFKKNLTISPIRIRKFCAITHFSSKSKTVTSYKPPHTLKEALEKTIRYEFLDTSYRPILFESE